MFTKTFKSISAYISTLQQAKQTQAYAAGRNRGRSGVLTNPHPRGSTEHTYWGNGYKKGRGEIKGAS